MSSRPKKIAKLSESKTSAKPAAVKDSTSLLPFTGSDASSNENQADNMFDLLTMETRRHIVSFFFPDVGFDDDVLGRWNVKQSVKCAYLDCSLVCKTWKNLIADRVNQEAVFPAQVISAAELGDLKSKICSLDLSGGVSTTFLSLVWENWGSMMIEDEWSAVELVVDHFGGEKNFARMILSEYKRFLLVKSVEHICETRLANVAFRETPELAAWLEKCHPSPIVELFWRAHILAPKKYLRDCIHLVGELIDHDALYQSPQEHHPQSDALTKQDDLLPFERRVLSSSEAWQPGGVKETLFYPSLDYTFLEILATDIHCDLMMMESE